MHFEMMLKKGARVLMVLSLALLAACAADEVAEEAVAVEEPAAAETMLVGEQIATDRGDLIIQPIGHATFAMEWDGKIVYVDPVGGADAFEGLPSPDLILITDIHGDHLNAETLEAVTAEDTVVIAPAAVVAQLPAELGGETLTLANGEETSLLDLSVEAVPMYNLTEDRLQYHEPGRGNGYVVTAGGQRIYISGDTEDIPEMRALENIDVAFVCFNLPFTMTEDQAASAVREFAPGIVYPYHFGESDTALFAELVGEDSGVDVRVLGWY